MVLEAVNLEGPALRVHQRNRSTYESPCTLSCSQQPFCIISQYGSRLMSWAVTARCAAPLG